MQYRIFLLLAPFAIVLCGRPAYAQIPNPEIYKTTVIDAQPLPDQATPPYQQTVILQLPSNADHPEQITIKHGAQTQLLKNELVSPGDQVIIQAVDQGNQTNYWIIDFNRTPFLIGLILFFALLVIISAGKKGLGALIGLALSIIVILNFIIPQILNGANPLVISIVGGIGILSVTLFLAHGLNKPTFIAWISTLISLIFVGIIATIAVELARLTGTGSENPNSLRIGITEHINLQGLFLGGIIIGALGVLDDITTGQTAVVFELKQTNPKLTAIELVYKARRVGIEHIASLVNTLVMAYAGVAMPILIILVINPQEWPGWAIFNSQIIAEEIIRTISGSIGLILAVPITTFIAAWYVHKKNPSQLSPANSHHH